MRDVSWEKLFCAHWIDGRIDIPHASIPTSTRIVLSLKRGERQRRFGAWG